MNPGGDTASAPGARPGGSRPARPMPLSGCGIEELVVRRLVLGGLLGASGADPSQLREVERAILLADGAEEGRAMPLERFLGGIESLSRSLPSGASAPGTFGWEWVRVERPEDLAPLFLGCRVVRAARRLAGYREAVLVVTGVTRALSAGSRQGREGRLAEIRCDLEGLVARRAPYRTRLTLHVS